jgi:hypothetical protein
VNGWLLFLLCFKNSAFIWKVDYIAPAPVLRWVEMIHRTMTAIITAIVMKVGSIIKSPFLFLNGQTDYDFVRLPILLPVCVITPM